MLHCRSASNTRAHYTPNNQPTRHSGAVVPIVTGLWEYQQAMLAGGAPKPTSLRRRKGGGFVARTWPTGMLPTFFPGFSGELWLTPGQEPTQGATYRAKRDGVYGDGRVALVLGAGNQLPVVGLDILHKLMVDDDVVLVKVGVLLFVCLLACLFVVVDVVLCAVCG